MGTIFTVFIKEIIDNIRDRRTLGSALIMGPIFGPVLFSFVINLSVERSLESAEKTLELPVIGPMSLLKETYLNHLGKLAFKHIYWNMLLPARPLPMVGSRMSVLGKQLHFADHR